MKKTYLFYLLISLLTLNSSVNAQHINYEDDRGWNLGFNLGGAWQPREATTTTTTIPYAGFSGGLTFGKSIFEKPGAFLALDWRFRYLQGWNSGWETTESILPVADSNITGYRNYKMNFNEYSLEAVITLHRLRERTGIILYGFGGVGLNNYAVKSNYTDGIFGYYDYSQIDPNESDIQIAEDLRRFDNDNNWETTTKARSTEFMPSLGYGLGYQFGPHFSMGFEWKTTYALHDNLDGITNGLNDRYNYAAMFFSWNLYSSGGRTTYTVPDNNNNVVVNSNNNNNSNNNINNWTNTTTPVGNKPLVNITNPSVNNTTVTNPGFTINANVYYVENKQDVIFKQNGVQSYNFTFNTSTNKFVANVTLQPGNNVFEIIGKNQYGTDSDSKIIILQQQVNVLPPPVVTITNPPYSPFNVTNPSFTVTATVLNITSPSQITYSVNGVNTGNFSYNSGSNVFSSTISLQPGNNTVQIMATNPQGSSTQTATINYQAVTIAPPVVTINYPNQNPFTTNTSLQSLNATVLNVNSKSQTSVAVNGAPVTNYTFNSSTHKLTMNVILIDGTNVVTVTGTNLAGSDSKTQTIIYRKPATTPKPVVDFTTPSTTPYNVSVSNMTLKAKVLNVNGSSNITVTANGSNVSNFTFNNLTKEVAFNTNLVIGNNVFTVKGTNQAGSDQDQVTVIYTKPIKEDPPVITITNPGVNPFSTSVNQEVINANIANVNSISGVTASFNGSPITNFTFDPVTDKFVYNATLITGANVLTINAVNGAGTASKSQTIIYTPQECLSPVISVVAPAQNPLNTTNSKGYIELNISNGGTVSFMINGQPSNGFNYNAATGKFTSMIARLEEGATVYTVNATNECGTTSQNITIIYAGEQPCDAPAINFINPVSSPFTHTGRNGNFTISASVVNAANQNSITVKLNGTPVNFNYDGTNYKISANVTLNQGTNTVEVSATNNCGTTTKATDIVFGGVTTQLPPPEILLTSPGSFPYTSPTTSLSVVGKVLNVTSKNDISVLFEGNAISNFTYNTSSKVISIPLSLTAGSHNLSITATNTVGNDNESVELIYNPPCTDPVITVTNPVGGQATLSSSTGTISASISNATTVSFKVNGQNSNNFSFNQTTGAFTASNIALTKGTMVFEIIANNECGSDSETITLNHEIVVPDCITPSLVFVSPSTNPLNYSNSKSLFAVNVNTQNVDANSTISVTLNNSPVNLTFNSRGNNISGTVNLVEGTNTIQVTVTNDCGTETISTVVNYSVPNSNENEEEGSGLNEGTLGANEETGNEGTNNGSNGESENSSGEEEGPGINEGTLGANAVNNSNNNQTTPCNDPTVTVLTPSSTPLNYTNTNNSYSISATVAGVDAQSGISFTQNGNPVTFNYSSVNQSVTANVNLANGTNNFVITATNDCGNESKTVVINYSEPVPLPEILITSPISFPYSTTNSAVKVSGKVKNVNSKNDITVTLDGQSISSFTYIPTTEVISIPLTLSSPGNHTLVITATNSAGSDDESVVLILTGNSPVVLINSHSITSTSSNPEVVSQAAVVVQGSVQNHQGATVTVDVNGSNFSSFTFNSTNGQVSIPLTLTENQVYEVELNASNQFGSDSKTVYLEYEVAAVSAPCGPRFNPGNSDWEFCLITPSGTYTRDDLASNSNFTYSGSASSLFFKPIAGGGNAIVNGQQYTVSSGSYYLFSGNLTVDVSSSHPGSMGHWEVCISSNAAPISGNGNNRPTSPCEATNPNTNNGNSNGNTNSNSNNNNSNNGNSGNGNNGKQSNEAIINKQYTEAIGKADMYYNAKKWSTARTYYEKALRLKPSESYPKTRLSIIENKLKPSNNIQVKPNNNGIRVIKPTNSGTKNNNSSSSKTNKTNSSSSSSSSSSKTNTSTSTKVNTSTKRKPGSNNASSGKTETKTENKEEEVKTIKTVQPR